MLEATPVPSAHTKAHLKKTEMSEPMSPDHCSSCADVAGLPSSWLAAHSVVAALPEPPPSPAPAQGKGHEVRPHAPAAPAQMWPACWSGRPRAPAALPRLSPVMAHGLHSNRLHEGPIPAAAHHCTRAAAIPGSSSRLTVRHPLFELDREEAADACFLAEQIKGLRAGRVEQGEARTVAP